MQMARIYFKNGEVVWTWKNLHDNKVLLNKDFYDAQGYYRADASYAEECSKEHFQRSLDMAKELLKVVCY